jgi:MFS family permease
MQGRSTDPHFADPHFEGQGEWRRGWRQLLAAIIASATGMPLYYAVFSLFSLGILAEFQSSRGELANVQALLIVGALVAPMLGRAFDRYGFRQIYAWGTLAVMAAHLAMATWVTSLAGFAVMAFVYGSAGLCSGPLGYTSLIAGWFDKARGLALGLAAIGVALMALVASPLLEWLIATEGWRAGYFALAALGGLIGVPLVLALARDAPRHVTELSLSEGSTDTRHFRDPAFWRLVFAHVAMAIPGAGLLSQLSPLIQDEGIGAKTAALAVAAYSVGQVTGRIVAGWFLDRSDPRAVAIFFTAVPAIGLVMLSVTALPVALAIAAAAMVGIQQGAEIDLFAFFTARRFGMRRYGRIYGGIVAAGWIGNAIGILGFGWLYVALGSYAVPEAIGAASLLIGAVLIAGVRLERNGAIESGSPPSIPLPTPRAPAAARE